MTVENILLFLGGLSVFILGVRLLCENCEALASGKIKWLFDKFGNRRVPAFLVGTAVSMVTQSSVAVNSALVSLADSKSISLKNACAVIVGVNVGTTVTTQLLSLSGASFNFTAVTCLVCFIGVCLSAFKKTKVFGYMLAGFGFIFIGLYLISFVTEFFKTQSWFLSIFKAQNPILLLSYGILFPAIMQSSAALNGMMIVLSSGGVMSFSQCVYLILGANIGSCVGVSLSAMGKSEVARRTANFNLVINVFGAIVLFPIMYFFSGTVEKLFSLTGKAERQIANFHTLYNLATALVVLPLLTFFVNLTDIKKFFKRLGAIGVKRIVND